jgi:hypothetical protein
MGGARHRSLEHRTSTLSLPRLTASRSELAQLPTAALGTNTKYLGPGSLLGCAESSGSPSITLREPMAHHDGARGRLLETRVLGRGSLLACAEGPHPEVGCLGGSHAIDPHPFSLSSPRPYPLQPRTPLRSGRTRSGPSRSPATGSSARSRASPPIATTASGSSTARRAYSTTRRAQRRTRPPRSAAPPRRR